MPYSNYARKGHRAQAPHPTLSQSGTRTDHRAQALYPALSQGGIIPVTTPTHISLQESMHNVPISASHATLSRKQLTHHSTRRHRASRSRLKQTSVHCARCAGCAPIARPTGVSMSSSRLYLRCSPYCHQLEPGSTGRSYEGVMPL